MLPAAPPKLPKWPFLLGDAALLGLAWYLARGSSPLTQPLLVGIVVCVALGSILAVIPFLVDYARRQDEALDDRQRALEGLSRTISSSAEQISIAAAGLQELTDAFKKHLQVATELTDRVTTLSQTRPAPEPLIPPAEKTPPTRSRRNGSPPSRPAPAEDGPPPTIAVAPGAPVTPEIAIPEVRQDELPVPPLVGEIALAASTPAPDPLPEPVPERSSAPAPEPPAAVESPAAIEPAAVEPAPVPPAAIAEVAPVAPSDSASPTPPRKRAPRKPKADVSPAGSVATEPPATAAFAAVTPDSTLDPLPAPAEPAPDAPPASAPQSSTLEAKAPAEVPAARTAADGATRLIVTAYIGIGNRLFIRGEGGGLTWDKGIPLQFVSIGKWRWEAPAPTSPVTFKLYKNDEQECAALGQLTLAPGAEQEIKASF